MEWGIREVGDWPDKIPTILSFEDIMSFGEITPSIQDIAQMNYQTLVQKKDNKPTINAVSIIVIIT